MQKRSALIVIVIMNLFCLGGLVWGYHIFNQLLIDMGNYVDSVEFNNRIGFLLLGFGIPLICSLILLENVRPQLIRKYSRIANCGTLVLVLLLFITSYVGSNHLRHTVEKAGYTNCHELNRRSTLSTFLVYTRSSNICEQLMAEKIQSKKK
jgi:amino acid permease